MAAEGVIGGWVCVIFGLFWVVFHRGLGRYFAEWHRRFRRWPKTDRVCGIICCFAGLLFVTCGMLMLLGVIETGKRIQIKW
jgi:hypothetical protein